MEFSFCKNTDRFRSAQGVFSHRLLQHKALLLFQILRKINGSSSPSVLSVLKQRRIILTAQPFTVYPHRSLVSYTTCMAPLHFFRDGGYCGLSPWLKGGHHVSMPCMHPSETPSDPAMHAFESARGLFEFDSQHTS